MNLFLEQCKRNWKRRLGCALTAGFVLSVCLVFGFCIENGGRVPYAHIVLYGALLLCGAFLSALIYILFAWLDNRKQERLPDKSYSVRQKAVRILGYAGILFAGWMPSFLGVYPGWFHYDAPWQLSMYLGEEISAHHPVLHTILLGWILEFMNGINGTYNKGIALYLVLQMGVMALCFGYVIYYMGKKNIGRIGRTLAVIWFICFPTIVLHVMSTTKDSLFAAFFVVFCILNYDLVREPERFFKRKLKAAGWVVLLFLCVVFRQNSLYALCIAAVFLVIYLHKYWKVLLGMASAFAVLYLLYTGPFYALFSVQPGSKAEFLSVPCQQTVKVYLEEKETLSEKEKGMLEAVFEPEAFSRYRPKLADFTKGNLKLSVLEENRSEYLELYASLLFQYPADYLDAFFLNTYGFFYPDATVDIYEDGVSYYFATEHVPPAVENSKIPFLLAYYKSFYTGFPVQDTGVLTWLLSMAAYFYLFFVVMMYLIYQKQHAGIFVCVCVLLLWMTYLLGPAALVRYVFFLYVLPPLEFAMLRDAGGMQESKECKN